MPKLIDDELFRPNGITISSDGQWLFVCVSCTGDFEPDCMQGDVIFVKYKIDDHIVTKVATFKHKFS